MKFFVVFALFVAAAQAEPFFMEPGLVNAETHDEFLKEIATLTPTGGKVNEKIASGTEAKKGEFPDFCYLSIGFYEKTKSCGCWIYEQQWVVTSARCVVDCSEKTASNVTVTIPALSGKDGIFAIEKVYVPDGSASNPAITEAFAASSLFTTIEPNNIAVIKLATPIPDAKYGDGKDTRKAIVNEMDADFTATQTRLGTTFKYRACGVGVIGNKGERAKGVVCTDVNIVPNANCKELYGAEPATFTPGTAQLCIQWPDRDSNVCVGDFGGPVYAYQLTEDKKGINVKTQEVVCTLIGSPNVRKNAPCLDGHITYCTFAPGPVATGSTNPNAWVNWTIFGTPPAVG